MFWFSLPSEFSNECVNHTVGCTDCPCACPEPMRTAVENVLSMALFDKIARGEVASLIPNPELFRYTLGEFTVVQSAAGFGPLVMDQRSVSLLDAAVAGLSFSELHERFSTWETVEFYAAVALLLQTEVLVSPDVGEALTPPTLSNRLHTWLHLTDSCNMACIYCFVPKSPRRMDPATATGGVEATFRSAQVHGMDGVRIKYAGGEATLNFAALRAAQQRAECLSNQTGISLESMLLSNGCNLPDELLDYLEAHQIATMLSLDGLQAVQDEVRPTRDPAVSSFQCVETAIDRLHQRGMTPAISVTITARSLPGLPALVEELLARGLLFQLNFYRQLSANDLPDPLVPTPNVLISGLRKTFAVIERCMPKHTLLPLLSDRVDLLYPHHYSCGAGRNYLVIDPEGRISRCQMSMQAVVTTIVDPDPLALVRSSSEGFQNLPVDKKDCAGCFWRYRCAGGCSRLAYQATGRNGTRSPLCAVYQAIIPDILRLEALRLLKHQPAWDFSTPWLPESADINRKG
jgi:uncharacterized protein